jgi:hypothetical protein
MAKQRATEAFLDLRRYIAATAALLPSEEVANREYQGVFLLGILARSLPDGEAALGEALWIWERQQLADKR